MDQIVRRVHVIGGAGSGKTTLARRLAAHLEAPVCDLDQVGYEGGAGASRPLTARLEDVHRIAAQPAWVTEGAFLWWTDELLAAADLIVWLDLPFRTAAARIVRRHARAEWRGDNRHPGWMRMLRLVGNVRRYHLASFPTEPRAPDDDPAITRIATEGRLRPYGGKLISCRTPRDIDNFLRWFTSTVAPRRDRCSGE